MVVKARTIVWKHLFVPGHMLFIGGQVWARVGACTKCNTYRLPYPKQASRGSGWGLLPIKRAGSNTSGFGYVSSSWRICLETGLVNVEWRNQNGLPDISRHQWSFWDEVAIIDVVLRGNMWESYSSLIWDVCHDGYEQMRTEWSNNIPPQNFFADGIDVRQGITVIECRQPIVAYHRVKFGLGSRLDIWVYRHRKEECVYRWNILESQISQLIHEMTRDLDTVSAPPMK